MAQALHARTTSDAQYYWANHITDAEWMDRYRLSGERPHRRWALEAVREFEGVATVLEIGCHCGPLLRQLAELPGVQADGIDINAASVAMAREAGLRACVGAVPVALERLPSRSFDVVVSSYCLAYIAPRDMPHAMAEVIRVARLGVVLVEPTAGPGVERDLYINGTYVEWTHEYLDEIARGRRRLPIPPAIEVTRTRKGGGVVNAVIVARLAWPAGS